MDDDKKAMHSDHRQINLQMLLSVFFMLGYFFVGPRFFPAPYIMNFEDRLGYALQWESLIALVVLVAIFNVGQRRYHASQEERDGIDTERLRVPLAFLSNTLEQGFCCFVVYLGLSVSLPSEQLVLIPLLCLLFVLGRLFFYIGYTLQPVWRAFGFGMTFLPCIAGALYLLYRLF